jgi:outer membrane protein OmpA-like peptidoglycan-associated protein
MKTYVKLTEAQKKELKKGVIEVTGKAMNRTALGVVDAIFTLYPNITFSELKEMLPDTINTSGPHAPRSIFKPHSTRNYGVIHSLEEMKKLFEEANLVDKDGKEINYTKFFFSQESEIFKTSDGVNVIVVYFWENNDIETKTSDLQNLIDHVSQYGIRVTKVEKNIAFNKGGYSLDVINPALLQVVQNPLIEASLPQEAKKKFPWWILLFLLLMVAGFLFFLTNGKEKEETVSQEEIVLPVELEETNSLSPLDEIKNQIAAGENTEGQSVSFHEILFEKDSDVLLFESEVYLNEVFQVLTDIPALKLLIVGHTSSEGDDNYNLKLSTKRALSVSAYLQSKGINADRLSTEGKGSASPISSNETEEGKKLNRRIEFVITDDGIKNN